MAEIKGTIEIDRPVEEVFAYIAEPKYSLEWERDVEVNEITSEGPMGVGSKGRRVEHYMGREELDWEVTEWTPNELVVNKYESHKSIGYGEWRTEPTDGGTRLTYRFGGTAKNPFLKLLMPLMMPMVHRQLRKDFRNLKKILESQS